MKYLTLILCAMLIFVLGFLSGRRSIVVTETTKVEYIELPPIKVTIEKPVPVYVEVPASPEYIYRTDTVTMLQQVDSAAILADWILKREYSGRVIEDSTGTVDYTATVQYNQLRMLGIDYTPIQRTVTTTRTIERRLPPFLLVGGNSAGFGQVEFGALIGNFGVAAEVGTDFRGTGYVGGKIGVKF